MELLPLPGPEDDIAILNPRRRDKKRSEQAGRNIVTGFETHSLAKREKETRRLSCIIQLAKEREADSESPTAAQLEQLVSELKADKPRRIVSRANPVSMRDFRRRFTGALLRLGREARGRGLRVKAFTLLSRDWILKEDELTVERLRQIVQQLKNHLARLGLPAKAGFVIAGLDGERDKTTGRYFIHFHGIVGGDYISAFRKTLRKQRAYQACPEICFPLKLFKLTNLPRQLSYIAKPMWFDGIYSYDKQGAVISRSKYPKRIAEPYHARYLSVLNQLPIEDSIILHGVRATKAGLRLT